MSEINQNARLFMLSVFEVSVSDGKHAITLPKSIWALNKTDSSIQQQ